MPTLILSAATAGAAARAIMAKTNSSKRLIVSRS
jgi:hypothetical protein